MVTVKISKRKRMRSKVYLKKGLPFFIASVIIVVGGLILIEYILKDNPYRSPIQWGWFVVSFLVAQYINVKYIVEK